MSDQRYEKSGLTLNLRTLHNNTESTILPSTDRKMDLYELFSHNGERGCVVLGNQLMGFYICTTSAKLHETIAVLKPWLEWLK